LWEQLKRGFEYECLNQVISIVICNHQVVDEKAYVNTYEMRNGISGKLFTDLIKVIILELPKVPEEKDGQAVWPWLKFMKGKTAEEQEKLAAAYPEVAMAVRKIKGLSGSERHRQVREAIGLRQTDMRMLKLAAWQDGEEEGRRKTAKNGKAMGLPVEQIAALTGLDPEEIKGL
jgi:predicted transposase/invertase (TIGR01784 family)